MTNKKILYIYIVAFIMIMIALITCLSYSLILFKSICAIILLSMMVALEYVAFGLGNRFFVDVVLFLGLGIGIIIGLNVNPDFEYIISSITLASFTIIVIASTIRALRKNP